MPRSIGGSTYAYKHALVWRGVNVSFVGTSLGFLLMFWIKCFVWKLIKYYEVQSWPLMGLFNWYGSIEGVGSGDRIKKFYHSPFPCHIYYLVFSKKQGGDGDDCYLIELRGLRALRSTKIKTNARKNFTGSRKKAGHFYIWGYSHFTHTRRGVKLVKFSDNYFPFCNELRQNKWFYSIFAILFE